MSNLPKENEHSSSSSALEEEVGMPTGHSKGCLPGVASRKPTFPLGLVGWGSLDGTPQEHLLAGAPASFLHSVEWGSLDPPVEDPLCSRHVPPCTSFLGAPTSFLSSFLHSLTRLPPCNTFLRVLFPISFLG